MVVLFLSSFFFFFLFSDSSFDFVYFFIFLFFSIFSFYFHFSHTFLTGAKFTDIKRLENELRLTKSSLSKERVDGSTTRQLLQEEASRVTDTASKQVADIQSRLDKAKRDHADSQASTASLLAA